MNNLTLLGFAFWFSVLAIAFSLIQAWVKKQQMKHELTLKLLEKGKDLDPELLAKLLGSDKPGVPPPPKSIAEQHREGSGMIGWMFQIAGLMIAFVGMVRHDFSWPLIGLGAFSFAFGWLCWIGAGKEYEKAKAEEKLAASRRD